MPAAPDRLASALDLAFWPALVVAGALFAAATLAPGLAEWRDVRARLAAADAELAALRDEVHELDRVAWTLREDPAFAAELARLDLGLPRAAGDRAGAALAPPPATFAAAAPTPEPAAWPGVDALADSRRLRAGLAAAAAGLLAVAFTLFQPAAAPLVRRATRGPRAVWGAVANRYSAS